jgi:hypothetical protein
VEQQGILSAIHAENPGMGAQAGLVVELING